VALGAARAADRAPDLRFGTVDGTREAARKGLDVLLVATAGELSVHTDALRGGNVGYEVVEVAE
jgi:putative transcriptional regulator